VHSYQQVGEHEDIWGKLQQGLASLFLCDITHVPLRLQYDSNNTMQRKSFDHLNEFTHVPLGDSEAQLLMNARAIINRKMSARIGCIR
jgi:hypothetical protein